MTAGEPGRQADRPSPVWLVQTGQKQPLFGAKTPGGGGRGWLMTPTRSGPSLKQAPVLTCEAAEIKKAGDLEPHQKEELFVQREEPGGVQPA